MFNEMNVKLQLAAAQPVAHPFLESHFSIGELQVVTSLIDGGNWPTKDRIWCRYVLGTPPEW